MRFLCRCPTLYAHMDAAMVPVYGCSNGLTIGCDMRPSLCVHHGWTHGDPHFCEWRPSLACANGDPHLAETPGCDMETPTLCTTWVDTWRPSLLLMDTFACVCKWRTSLIGYHRLLTLCNIPRKQSWLSGCIPDSVGQTPHTDW